ncbi:BnaC09g12590D [Brassica napus]|uniref:BnaC09g12590D protein n=1 Tax=Brassica napus TaxID=3708 RepID=A0A078F5F5_BRANA|nr:BnaC09g12590D [Brassica napus]
MPMRFARSLNMEKELERCLEYHLIHLRLAKSYQAP